MQAPVSTGLYLNQVYREQSICESKSKTSAQDTADVNWDVRLELPLLLKFSLQAVTNKTFVGASHPQFSGVFWQFRSPLLLFFLCVFKTCRIEVGTLCECRVGCCEDNCLLCVYSHV